jgi:hypothetical protein
LDDEAGRRGNSEGRHDRGDRHAGTNGCAAVMMSLLEIDDAKGDKCECGSH